MTRRNTVPKMHIALAEMGWNGPLCFLYLVPMSADDAARFRNEYEECQAQAALPGSPSTKAQWLLFAQEWLKLAEAAEDQQRREAATSTVAPAK